MIAWRVRTGTRIEALGDEVGAAPVGNVPLAEVQRRALAAVGLAVRDVDDVTAIPPGDHVVLLDRLWVSAPLLRSFLKRAAKVDHPVRLALQDGALTRLTTFTGEQDRDGDAVLYGLWRTHGGALSSARPLVVPIRAKALSIPFSARIPTMPDQPLALTDEVAIELTSWVHLWQANLYAIAETFVGLLRRPTGWLRIGRAVLLGLLTPGSLRPFAIASRILGHLVIRGRRCKVHPSAVVEACVLGDDVEIGPNAVVRGSILGSGVVVQERAAVEGSVLGDRVLVNQNGTVKAVLAYPDAVFHFLQASVVGERVFLGMLFKALDMRFQGTVRIRHRGALVDTGMPFLGGCLGHRSLVTGGSRLQPGRVLPNDCRVLSDMGAIVDVPDDVDTTDFVVDRRGALGPAG